MKHAVYVPAGDERKAGITAVIVVLLVILVVLWLPRPSHAAATDPKPKPGQPVTTVTITGPAATVCVYPPMAPPKPAKRAR
jgi:hypothetical protein